MAGEPVANFFWSIHSSEHAASELHSKKHSSAWNAHYLKATTGLSIKIGDQTPIFPSHRHPGFSRPICACKLSLVPLKCQCRGVRMYILAMDFWWNWPICTSPSIHSLFWYVAIINLLIFSGGVGIKPVGGLLLWILLVLPLLWCFLLVLRSENLNRSGEIQLWSITSHYCFVLYCCSVFQWNILHANELLKLFSPVLVIVVFYGNVGLWEFWNLAHSFFSS